MSITLKDFTIPENCENVTGIDIRDYKTLASPKKMETCLIACTNLKRINISLYAHQISKEEPNYTLGEAVFKIATYGKNIVSLHLQSPSLLDKDLRFISQENLPALRELAIPRSSNIGALGIKYVASQCPDLTSLLLFYSLYKETDEAAFYIGKFLPNLKRINMHRSCNLSDSGLSVIAEGCQYLETIEVGRNYELTDESLKKISKNCPDLITLKMNYNKKITEKGLQYIIDGCPKFKNFCGVGGSGAIKAIKEVQSKFPRINFS